MFSKLEMKWSPNNSCTAAMHYFVVFGMLGIISFLLHWPIFYYVTNSCFNKIVWFSHCKAINGSYARIHIFYLFICIQYYKTMIEQIELVNKLNRDRNKRVILNQEVRDIGIYLYYVRDKWLQMRVKK